MCKRTKFELRARQITDQFMRRVDELEHDHQVGILE